MGTKNHSMNQSQRNKYTELLVQLLLLLLLF